MSASAGLAAFSVVVLLLFGALYFVGTRRQRLAMNWLFALLAVTVASFFALRRSETSNSTGIESQAPPVASSTVVELPAVNHDAGFSGAESCRECHQDQFATWHRTFHRTMTQAATEESVIPSFDDVTLSSRGRRYHLTRRSDEFWVDTISPAAEMAAFARFGSAADPSMLPRVQSRIAMTTGSHYHQTYWMQNSNGTLVQFPWVYHVKSDRWVYRIDSFLRPPSDTVTFNIWNMTCIACHSTGAVPNVDGTTKSMHSTAELGISCEACHGPGSDHIADARQRIEDSQSLSVSMPHPGNLDAERSSQICGQCHVIAGRTSEEEFLANGDPYRAGQSDFEKVRQVIWELDDAEVEMPHFANSVKTGFWPDGTVRTGGREYNGLIRTPCYSEGTGDRQMSCVSCHSMHNYESPNKLMAKDKLGDRQCVQCHDESEYTTNLEVHTHHTADAEGSRCVNCHMPHTSYALFSAIRSHRVQSPSVRTGSRGTRPNACNLCHLDETKTWTAQHLKNWYGIESPKINGDEAEISAGALWALKGDAAQRAIMAWHFGWQPAQQAAGHDWMIPLLSDLLTDSYSAVRYIAYESLRTFSGFGDLKYDFDGSLARREETVEQVLRKWQSLTAPDLHEPAELRRLLLDEPRQRDTDAVKRLLGEQDETPISIVE